MPQPAVREPGQAPRTATGLKAASTDENTIRAWWDRWPTANVGVRTGIKFDVLDLDGPDALNALDEAGVGQGVIEGPMTLTGRGVHIYTEATGLGNRAGVLAGVDWRGCGGYVVAPPSRHPNGSTYMWGPAHGLDTPLRPVPPWLRHLLAQRPAPAAREVSRGGSGSQSAYGRRALESELGRLVLTPEGARNDELHRAAFRLGQLVASGDLDAAEVAGDLLTVADRIGLDAREASATVTSGMRAGVQAPRRPAGQR